MHALRVNESNITAKVAFNKHHFGIEGNLEIMNNDKKNFLLDILTDSKNLHTFFRYLLHLATFG